MRLVSRADKTERLALTKDRKTGEEAGMLVRRIPAAVTEEIELDVLGHKRQAKYKKGVQLIDYDVARSKEITRRKAMYALVDSYGKAELPAEDVPALSASAQDGFVVLDGHWTDEVKRQVFEAYPQMAVDVVSKADELDAQALEEEEGKGWSS